MSETFSALNVNLLLAGFPKCGTTALADWLGDSNAVEVSTPKETFLLCTEFAFFHKRALTQDLSTSFPKKASKPYRCEATTLNVYSDSALALARQDERVKVILAVRDQSGGMISWHNQLTNAGLERVPSPDKAWAACLAGFRSAHGDGLLLNYATACSYGRHVDRWVSALTHDRVLLIHQDDLRSRWPSALTRLRHFLGSDLRGPSDIPERNVFGKIRFRGLYSVLRRPGVRRVWYDLERRIPAAENIRRVLRHSVLSRRSAKPLETGGFTSQLDNYFADDRILLASLQRENLLRWPGNGD